VTEAHSPIWGAIVNGAAAGVAPASDWRTWERAGRVPPSGDGNGVATRVTEDLDLLAEHGLPAVRLTVDWARLVPVQGRPDATELEGLGSLLDAADAAGVAVWACLHEVALPGWFVDEGSFGDDRARISWSRWVELVADTIGDRVAGWVPLAEPVTWAIDGYLRGSTPPGRRDPERFAEELRGLHLAWRDAWRILRGGGPPVATCHRVGPVHAADATIPARQQANLVDRTLWGSWVGGLRDGILRVPGRAEEEVADLAGSGDVVGIAYEGATAVTAEGGFAPFPTDARVAESGWAPWPEGLAETLRRLADELPGRPVMVGAQGVGTRDDELRADVLRESVAVVDAAIDDGIDVRAWFHRSAVDGYEWTYGFDVPYGLFDRDRNAKGSVEALQAAIAAR
jgi:beta-glucosidase